RGYEQTKINVTRFLRSEAFQLFVRHSDVLSFSDLKSSRHFCFFQFASGFCGDVFTLQWLALGTKHPQGYSAIGVAWKEIHGNADQPEADRSGPKWPYTRFAFLICICARLFQLRLRALALALRHAFRGLM